MKLGIYKYFPDMVTHANPDGAVTTWVVWVNSQFATVWFLSMSFHVPSTHTQVAPFLSPILTVHMSYDVFSPKDMPFGVN